MPTAAEWPRYHYAGTLVRMKDGDTAVIRLDLGLDPVEATKPIRVNGLYCPESKGASKVRGLAAAAYGLTLLQGRRLYIRTIKDEQSFERWVGDVFWEGPGGQLVSYADAMRTAGFDDGPPVGGK